MSYRSSKGAVGPKKRGRPRQVRIEEPAKSSSLRDAMMARAKDSHQRRRPGKSRRSRNSDRLDRDDDLSDVSGDDVDELGLQRANVSSGSSSISEESLDFDEHAAASVQAEDIVTASERAREQRARAIVAGFDEAQEARYTVFRRSNLPKGAVRSLMHEAGGGSGGPGVPEKSVVAMCGVTKIFVGELVEAAREIRTKWAAVGTDTERGALQPRHVREAYRQMRESGRLPYAMPRSKKRKFR